MVHLESVVVAVVATVVDSGRAATAVMGAVFWFVVLGAGISSTGADTPWGT